MPGPGADSLAETVPVGLLHPLRLARIRRLASGHSMEEREMSAVSRRQRHRVRRGSRITARKICSKQDVGQFRKRVVVLDRRADA